MDAMLAYLANPNPPYAPIHNARELFNAALVADSDLAYLERHDDIDDVPFPPEYNRWGVSGAINEALYKLLFGNTAVRLETGAQSQVEQVAGHDAATLVWELFGEGNHIYDLMSVHHIDNPDQVWVMVGRVADAIDTIWFSERRSEANGTPTV